MNNDQIRRIANPSQEQLDLCITQHRPVIFTGMMEDQIASRSWTVPYLKTRLGSRMVKVVTHDKPRLFWDPDVGLPLRPLPFDSFAERTFEGPGERRGEGSCEGKSTGYSYVQEDINCLPDIRDDYVLPNMMAAKGIVRSKFWLSGAGLITPLHYDPVETMHWVIRGSKRFICYEPGVRKYYPYPAGSTAPFISQVDPDHPDPERFPRFGAARPIEFQLQEGEVLYLPTYWWHQVYSQGSVNISLNFVWFASAAKAYRHLAQSWRARKHIARGVAQVKANARAAHEEMQRREAAASCVGLQQQTT